MYAIRSYYVREQIKKAKLFLFQKRICTELKKSHQDKIKLESRHVSPAPRKLKPRRQNTITKFRITSYNVCYTKLLRPEFAAEYKLDGERVQLHMKGENVVLFSRSLENISKYYPDIIEKIPKIVSADQVILEAEAVAINENTGEFLPFQELMHRRRKYKIEKAVSQYPITVNFFDVLYHDGKTCLSLNYQQRRKILEKIIKEDEYAKLVPMTLVRNENDIEEFLENSINSGCEGLMRNNFV